MNNENKSRKTAKERSVRFNALDFCIIISLFAIALALAVRFIPVDRLTETHRQYEVVFTVKNLPSSAVASAGLKEGDGFVTGDGTEVGTFVSMAEKPSTLVSGDSGETAEYPAGTLSDITITLLCELKVTKNGNYIPGGDRISAGTELELFSRLAAFDGYVVSVRPVN